MKGRGQQGRGRYHKSMLWSITVGAYGIVSLMLPLDLQGYPTILVERYLNQGKSLMRGKRILIRGFRTHVRAFASLMGFR